MLNQFWHRRVCGAITFVGGGIVVLYLWSYFNLTSSTGASVSIVAVIAAVIVSLLGLISYFWPPRRHLGPVTLGLYGLLAITTALLIGTSGGADSAFVPLWILLAIFAGVFGLAGMIFMFLLGNVYLLISLTGGQGVAEDLVATTVIAGWLPLVASYIIWHTNGNGTKDHAYRNLASELNEVANKAEVVINAIADGVIAVDNEGIVQLINPAAQQITGWGRQDATTLSYKTVLKLTDSKDHELTPANDPVQQVLQTNEEVETNTLSLTTHSGRKLLLSVIVSPVGRPGAGAIIVFRDITKEKAEEREQAEFISTASHEMRTPVASIEGYLGLALNPATATIDEKARDFLAKAQASAKHLGRLFQDLLDVSKAEDGRLSNTPRVVDVVEATQTIVEGFRPQADAKQLRLAFKPMPDGPATERRLSPVLYANVDNDHLREVIANLTENAIKYTLKGDVVVDVYGDQNDHVIISVTDSGIGIPAEDIPHLFQKFYRIDNSDTREIGGTGLGLYLSRRLADIMDGRIWVESTFKKGSTFFLEIPRISHEEAMRLTGAAAAQEVEQQRASDRSSPSPAGPSLQPTTAPPATGVVPGPARPQNITIPPREQT